MRAKTNEEMLNKFFETFEKSVNDNEPDDIIERIRHRREKLYQVGGELKAYFVGLDSIIDEIIHNIENWYVMPELNSRPVVVCLWGMTGVGKTDLVRKLTKAIGFGDRFLEIQMSGDASSSHLNTSMRSELSGSNIKRGEPGVILLDEIQRWRTVADNGMDMKNTRYQDLWMLLSDGKFNSRVSRKEIAGIAYGSGNLYWVPEFEEFESDGEDSKKKKRTKSYNYSYSDAAYVKNLLRLEEPISEIMRWSQEKKQEVALGKINDPSVYDGDDYSNVLIFISGNLDEAYGMADSVDDTDVDADVLHAFSKKINFLNIKRALRTRFKPEQIARFGNNHVIYPSMSKDSYEELISRKLVELSKRIEERHGIKTDFDRTINDFVYRNGVIPSQGVRPVFSTLGGYIENAMPSLLLAAIENGISTITISYANGNVSSRIADELIVVETRGKIDQLRRAKDLDNRSLVSVHEAGHALAYAILFKVAPTQIISKTTSSFKDGFIGCHDVKFSMKSLEKMITVAMAGRAAEEVVFGGAEVSSGAKADIIKATALASSYFREFGFGKHKTLLRTSEKAGSEYANAGEGNDINESIEKLVSDCLDRSIHIILNNINPYKELVKALVADGKIEVEELVSLFENFGIRIKKMDPKSYIIDNYSDKLDLFLNRR